jgi:hypothetical protein
VTPTVNCSNFEAIRAKMNKLEGIQIGLGEPWFESVDVAVKS